MGPLKSKSGSAQWGDPFTPELLADVLSAINAASACKLHVFEEGYSFEVGEFDPIHKLSKGHYALFAIPCQPDDEFERKARSED